MRAAVVRSFGSAPRYEEFPAPVAAAGELVVDVLAAGLHPRVRSQADGSHYTSTGELPLVPGIDGVGRGPDGVLRYFVLPDTALGSMAEQTVIDPRRSIELPAGADPVAVAAAMNPAMSSWVALRQRVDFRAGQDVLVLGATGNAGRLAVQVARHLGAGRVVAAGRSPAALAELGALGATDTVQFGATARPGGATAGSHAHDAPAGAADDSGPDGGSELGKVAAEVDMVLDYLWGAPTAAAMTAVVTGRADRSRPLTWIEIGSVAGPAAEIPSAALRAARLQIVGSGQGSVGTRDILTALPELAAEIVRGAFDLDATAVPLADVAAAWADPGRRLVLVP